MVFVDTNVVLRWLLGDHELSKRAQHLVTEAKPDELLITDVVSAEIVYVLGGLRKDRQQVREAFMLLRQSSAFMFESDHVIRRTIDLLATSKLDFADCYLLARAVHTGAELATFDNALQRRYDKVKADEK
ncbi:MAG TPA: PIN domain-containing protein [Candidatus Saccharimonadales bacterium]|nr:PIN domain-containing protein [Candidatus Saccharimonadales bacterium]